MITTFICFTLWFVLLFLGGLKSWIAGFWFAVGAGLVLSSRSRGPLADFVFLINWPVHALLTLFGKE